MPNVATLAQHNGGKIRLGFGAFPMLKIVLVGDTTVGKTSLIKNYLYNTFSENYELNVLDVYRYNKSVNKQQI